MYWEPSFELKFYHCFKQLLCDTTDFTLMACDKNTIVTHLVESCSWGFTSHSTARVILGTCFHHKLFLLMRSIELYPMGTIAFGIWYPKLFF